MLPDEHSLVKRAQAGDHSAYRQLVQQYQQRAFAVARGILGSDDEAMDAVQDAFIRAYTRLDRFHGNARFYTWLYRIVVNACIDRIRRNQRENTVEFDDGRAGNEASAVALSSGFPSPDTAVHRQQLGEQIAQAMATLSEEHRTVILLREVEGMSYKEIAKVMKCSLGTVMSRLFHARKRLQQTLTDVGVEALG